MNFESMNTQGLLPITAIRQDVRDCRFPQLAASVFLASAIAMSIGCAKEKTEEAVVPVTAASVQKADIQRVVTADAVLFPLQQAALVPKISSPVKQFLVNSGSKVHKGQLLAVHGVGDHHLTVARVLDV